MEYAIEKEIAELQKNWNYSRMECLNLMKGRIYSYYEVDPTKPLSASVKKELDYINKQIEIIDEMEESKNGKLI